MQYGRDVDGFLGNAPLSVLGGSVKRGQGTGPDAKDLVEGRYTARRNLYSQASYTLPRPYNNSAPNICKEIQW